MEVLPEHLSTGPSLPIGVSSVSVRDLHGKFNYDVDFSEQGLGVGGPPGNMMTVSDDRLTLLYGKNGSGKTSLLRLLFHAVSAAPSVGHRTALARTRFRRLEVRLTDGSIVAYSRSDEQPPIGPCTALVQRPGTSPAVWEMLTEEGGRVPPARQQMTLVWDDAAGESGVRMHEPEDYAGFMTALRNLDLNPVLLADSRRITSDVVGDDDDEQSPAARKARLDDEQTRARDVLLAIARARRYLGQVAFAGTQLGSSRVENVYLGVTEAISEQAAAVDPSASLPDLIQRVERIGKQTEKLHRYGLMADFGSAKLVARLDGASDQDAGLLHRVLDPYLEGLEQRIEALKPGLEAVSAYIDALNDFLEGKKAQFFLGPNGVVIRDEVTDERLEPQHLSSGEKQIVLLFSDIVALQERTKLFIIDEPELSLNAEWQRHLMPRLLAVTSQSRMQLIAATHSIEIMARYRDRIRELPD